MYSQVTKWSPILTSINSSSTMLASRFNANTLQSVELKILISVQETPSVVAKKKKLEVMMEVSLLLTLSTLKTSKRLVFLRRTAWLF